jgi:hypothetical protein
MVDLRSALNIGIVAFYGKCNVAYEALNDEASSGFEAIRTQVGPPNE